MEKEIAPDELPLRRMLASIRHRGPDDSGIYLGRAVALGSVRLSIIDLADGCQPVCNEDQSLWIVFNGEIFNYLELRKDLEARGHRFSTFSDTEVILHLYEESGPECLQLLNGQFAFAIWDEHESALFLARDRLGVRPLFYTINNGMLLFGSEIKAIANHPSVKLEIDPVAVSQVFTFWSVRSPYSIFRKVYELPPGCYGIAFQGDFRIRKYWTMEFPDRTRRLDERRVDPPEEELLEVLRELLAEAVKLRLRADVPVGAYLSGGLDSSIIAFFIRRYSSSSLDTFSISFQDSAFDESVYQKRMAAYLGTDHKVVHATYADIGKVFPDVIRHTETPLLRTAPAPMFLLSKLVRDSHYKVVLTGEGADEFLAGYDIFKEAKIRRFWARQPGSKQRPRLLLRLYQDIPRFSRAGSDFAYAFFKSGLTGLDAPHYSHAIRWRNTQRTQLFFSRSFLGEMPRGKYGDIEYPQEFCNWGTLEQSQYLEITTFLSSYLLSSQGDRVAMAHSVEGRHPFLDHRVVDFCNHLPANFKLRGLKDKYLLRKLAKTSLPDGLWQRPKRPYRAPVHRSFFNEQTPDYVHEILSPEALKRSGMFDADAVRRLVQKITQCSGISETEDMALTGILSTQLVHEMFVHHFQRSEPLTIRKKITASDYCPA